MKAKKTIAVCSVVVILMIMAVVLAYTYKNVPGTYENAPLTDVSELQENPSDYDIMEADGIAEIIVKENLDKTNAMNDVASIVFDFRGFDTLGESFILLTAIAGTFVILSVTKKSKKGEDQKCDSKTE